MKLYDKNECIAYYQRKYDYMNIMDIDLLYDIAIDMYINLRFPFRNDLTEEIINEDLKHHPTWCLRCMQEMIDKQGISNLVGYAENGVSFKFDKSGLSQSIIDEITSESHFC